MRFLLGMCALLTIPLWAATQVTTRIHDIDHGDHITDDALVFLTSGQVMKINVNNTDLLEKLNESVQKRGTITLEFDENREILDVLPQTETEPVPNMSIEEPKILSADPMAGYNPSVLTPENVKSYFREMRHASKEETQCFNRAMVWTYEMRVKHNVYSQKIWIFFTRKYIRKIGRAHV